MKSNIINSVIIGSLLFSTPVFADWIVRVEDDAFSDVPYVMMFGSDDGKHNVAFECSSGSPSLSYIEQSDDIETFRKLGSIPADIVFRVDKNPAVKIQASTEVRNSSHIGIKSDDIDAIKTLLTQLQQSKGKSLVGVRFPQIDQKFSFSIKSKGSTAAVQKFITTCKINLADVKK
ncbi:hypothetical protein [Escherichia albertii]|uniref:hypothetical protein n=1 Tax=Escherichia albertii TaxID=208962 RepID=UPI0011325F47|nr:hypothetical protein [Escherichia albertii]